MSITIPDLISSDQQFRKQVRDALTALSNGSGIADNSIALSKLVQIGANDLLGNRTSGTANVTGVVDKGKWAP